MRPSSHRAPPSSRSVADPEALRRWRAERREVARTHHPDVGGDVEEYLAQLADVDRRHGVRSAAQDGSHPAATSTKSGRVAVLQRSSRRYRRRLRGLVRAGRARLPRGVPGRRTYIRL